MTKPTLTDVAEFLKISVDWPRFARLTKAIGTQLDIGQLRFLKSRIFEKSLVPYSNNTLQYIADKGRDFYIPKLDIYLEMKYIENAIYTPARKILKKTTGNIQLMNSHGTNSHKVLPSTYADFLLFVGNQGAMVFDSLTLGPHINPKGDGIIADIPINKGVIISSPKEMTGNGQKEIDFLKGLDKMIEDFIRNVC
jgi:hypothetical protein